MVSATRVPQPSKWYSGQDRIWKAAENWPPCPSTMWTQSRGVLGKRTCFLCPIVLLLIIWAARSNHHSAGCAGGEVVDGGQRWGQAGLLLWGACLPGESSSALQSCYSRATLCRGPVSPGLQLGRWPPLAHASPCFRCSKWSCVRARRSHCPVPAVCPGLCCRVTGSACWKGWHLPRALGCAPRSGHSRAFLHVSTLESKSQTWGKYWGTSCPAQLLWFVCQHLVLFPDQIETLG